MTHTESAPRTPTAAIAARVKELRGRLGWSATRLGEELGKHGLAWDRFTVNALEGGRRQNVTVVELLTLALALDVAPIHLLVPLDNRPYAVTAGRSVPADEARAWVRGELALPGVDEDTYRREVAAADLRRRADEQAAFQHTYNEATARGQAAAEVRPVAEILRQLAERAERGEL